MQLSALQVEGTWDCARAGRSPQLMRGPLDRNGIHDTWSYVQNDLRRLFCGAVFALSAVACDVRGGLTPDDAVELARVYMREREDTLVAHLDTVTVERDGEYWRVQFLRREKGQFPVFRSILVHHTTGEVVPQLDR
jgi:hypothetical protein